MDKAKWNRSVRRLTWNVKHNGGGRGGGRLLIFLLAAALVVMTAKLFGGLPKRLGEELAEGAAALNQRLGERMLLQNRPLLSYIRGGEEARGTFRFMSEQLFGRELSFEEVQETGGESADRTSGGENTYPSPNDGTNTEAAGSGSSSYPESISGGDGTGNNKENPSEDGSGADDIPSHDKQGEENKGTGDKELVQIGESLLDQVKAENEGYGSYLPVGYVHGNIERLPVSSSESGQPGGAGTGSGGSGPAGGDLVGSANTEGPGGAPGESGAAGISAAKLLLENNYPLEKLSDSSYLLSNYYIVDSVTSAVPELFDGSRLLAEDLTIGKGTAGEKQEGYQILIYHTHASEGFSDSRPGEVMDTVRGPGEKLAEYLRAHGYTVYHDMTAYDRKDGKDNRNYAYTTARPKIEEFLAEHPEVEVIIDLHRDSGAKRVTEIDGKKTAKIMLFNGLCRNSSGPIADLENPNLVGNLSFSLQLNLVGRVLYPDLMYRIYLKNYRYNQHFRKRSLLIELGTEQNTVQEAYNAMEPLAELLDTVLRKQ